MCTRHEQMTACRAELVQEVSQASQATLLTALNDVPHFRCHFTNAALNLSSLISGCQNMPKPCQHSVTAAADLAHFIPEWCKTKNSKSFKAPHLERIESPASLTLPLGRSGQTWGHASLQNVTSISCHLIKALMGMSLLAVHWNNKTS